MNARNLTQRARRYARSKSRAVKIERDIMRERADQTIVDLTPGQALLVIGFRDGYRYAMRRLRLIIDDTPGGSDGVPWRVNELANDTTWLK